MSGFRTGSLGGGSWQFVQFSRPRKERLQIHGIRLGGRFLAVACCCSVKLTCGPSSYCKNNMNNNNNSNKYIYIYIYTYIYIRIYTPTPESNS